MTNPKMENPMSESVADYAALAARFRPVFARIAEGAAEREVNRTLPLEPIRWLKEAGFGTLRIPQAQGGFGATLPQLFQLLTELAEADSNLPQALRAHFAFVEDRLNQPDSEERQRWFRRFADGELVGSGWTEIGTLKLGEVITRVTPSENGWLISGEKFYSTGTLYADWIDVYAQRNDNGRDVIALVNTHQPGVEREDDWDGFGQRLSGSGTTRFREAQVEQAHVYDFTERFRYQTAFYQHVLLSTLAGIGRAVKRDAAAGVASRKRIYSHGNATQVKNDVQVLQVVGQISSWVYAVEAAVQQATHALQRAYEVHNSGDEDVIQQANVLAELESAQAQVIATELIPRAATELFNALGASDTRISKALDRHWRNARTVSSHNPVIYKIRNVGDWEVNGKEPTFMRSDDWLRVLRREQRKPVEKKEPGGRALRLPHISATDVSAREKQLAELLVTEWHKQRREKAFASPLCCYWQGTQQSWQAFHLQMAATFPDVLLPSQPEPWQGEASLAAITCELADAEPGDTMLIAGCQSLAAQSESALPAGEAAVLWLAGRNGQVQLTRGETFCAENGDVLPDVCARALDQSELKDPPEACPLFSRPDLAALAHSGWDVSQHLQDASWGNIGNMEALTVLSLAAIYAAHHQQPCGWIARDPMNTLALGIVKPDGQSQ